MWTTKMLWKVCRLQGTYPITANVESNNHSFCMVLKKYRFHFITKRELHFSVKYIIYLLGVKYWFLIAASYFLFCFVLIDSNSRYFFPFVKYVKNIIHPNMFRIKVKMHVWKLGLSCCHPDPQGRLTMKQVVTLLLVEVSPEAPR